MPRCNGGIFGEFDRQMASTVDPNANCSATNIAHPSPADVEHSVEAIIRSEVLGKSDRRASLLRYLVEMELNGRGEELKAFTIAVDILGRNASFDPTTDSIVRSEVGRLRDALRLYFAELAESDQLRIEIPKGTYRPAFSIIRQRPKPDGAGPRAPAALYVVVGVVVLTALLAFYFYTGPNQIKEFNDVSSVPELPYDVVRIAVAPSEMTGNNPNPDNTALGLRAELMMHLSAFPWISVVSPVHSFADLASDQADYVLDTEIHWESEAVQAYARLVTFPDEKIIWSNNQLISTETMAIRRAVLDLSNQIISKLGSSHGIAPELTKAKNAHASPENLDAFICYLGLHRYLSAPSSKVHLGLRECLLDAVATFPSFGDGWAALALVHIDEARFGSNKRPGADAWVDAEIAIEQALKFAPIRMPTLNVVLIHSIEAPTQDLVEFERASNLLVDLYPRHPPTLYNVGSRMAEFSGKWDEGLFLVNQAISLTPDPPSTYFLTSAYHAAMLGSDEELLEAVKPLTTTTAVSQLLLNYIAVSRSHQTDNMLKYRGLLSDQGLFDDKDIIQHVKGRRYAEELESALLHQLDKAFQLSASQ